MPGLHICNVALRGADSRGEFVEIANQGADAVVLTNLELTDYTPTQQRSHRYKFPSLSDGSALTLSPGQTACIFTGHGRDELDTDGSWLLFAGHTTNVWNDTGDVAYLRSENG